MLLSGVPASRKKDLLCHLKHRLGIAARFGMLQGDSLQLQISKELCQLGIPECVSPAYCSNVAALFSFYQRCSLGGQESLNNCHRDLKNLGEKCQRCLLAPGGHWELLLQWEMQGGFDPEPCEGTG